MLNQAMLMQALLTLSPFYSRHSSNNLVESFRSIRFQLTTSLSRRKLAEPAESFSFSTARIKILRKTSQAKKMCSSKNRAQPHSFEITYCLGIKASILEYSQHLIAIGYASSLVASKNAQQCYASVRVSSRPFYRLDTILLDYGLYMHPILSVVN